MDFEISYAEARRGEPLVVVAAVVDVAGTYHSRSAVLPSKSQLVRYNKSSFYRGFYIATGRSVQRALETVAVLMVTALVAAHCDSKGSFEGHSLQYRNTQRNTVRFLPRTPTNAVCYYIPSLHPPPSTLHPPPPLFPLSSCTCTYYAHTSLAHTYMVVTMRTHKLAYLCPMHSTQLYHCHTLRALTYARPVARIFQRGVTWMSDLYVCLQPCRSREVWGHLPQEIFRN